MRSQPSVIQIGDFNCQLSVVREGKHMNGDTFKANFINYPTKNSLPDIAVVVSDNANGICSALVIVEVKSGEYLLTSDYYFQHGVR